MDMDADVETADCAICLASAPQLCTALRTTACGHCFCEGCLCTYAMKKPLGTPVPCPMCRQPLTDDSIPYKLTLTLDLAAGAALGFSVGRALPHGADGENRAEVMQVTPGGVAEAAGLRAKNMWLLAIDGAPLARDERAADIVARLRRHSGRVTLRIEWERPTPPLHYTASPLPAQPAAGNSASSIACFCFCTVTAQVWQRALRLPAWTCYVAAAVLWVTCTPRCA